eukprot:8505814-Alexandrium_andersonii.AAC.1
MATVIAATVATVGRPKFSRETGTKSHDPGRRFRAKASLEHKRPWLASTIQGFGVGGNLQFRASAYATTQGFE